MAVRGIGFGSKIEKRGIGIIEVVNLQSNVRASFITLFISVQCVHQENLIFWMSLKRERILANIALARACHVETYHGKPAAVGVCFSFAGFQFYSMNLLACV